MEGPVLVPEVAVDIGNDERYRLVERIVGDDGSGNREPGSRGVKEDESEEGEDTDIDERVHTADDDELGELPDERESAREPGGDDQTEQCEDDDNRHEDEAEGEIETWLGGLEDGEEDESDDESGRETEEIIPLGAGLLNWHWLTASGSDFHNQESLNRVSFRFRPCRSLR